MEGETFRKILYGILVVIAIVLIFVWNSDSDDESDGEVIVVDGFDEENATTEHSDEVTSFYRLQYILADGKKIQGEENKGQFITFYDGGCYESDINGESVGNGSLAASGNTDEKEIYTGMAYWGDNCTFTFTNNRRTLRVLTANEKVIVYKRTAPPSGRTTCSLIRSEGSRIYIDQPLLEPDRTSSSSSEDNRKSEGHYVKVDCPQCKGTGRIAYTVTVSSFGMPDELRRCPECGEMHYSDHKHKDCPLCHGTGKVERKVFD